VAEAARIVETVSGANRMTVAAWLLDATLGAVADAGRERAAYQAAKQRVPSDAMIGYNPASAVLLVCDAVLDARIAAAGNNLDSALQAWQKAVAAEDALSYDEPADWFYPTRESLGFALLRRQRLEDAERVFRDDLTRNRNNPRSLFGLAAALRAQKKSASRYRGNWQGPPLRIADL